MQEADETVEFRTWAIKASHPLGLQRGSDGQVELVIDMGMPVEW